MKKPRPNDISVGPDRWITFIDIENRTSGAVAIDEILQPVFPFFDLLEKHCVAECCGIDAYSLWPVDIAEAFRDYGSLGSLRDFEQIRKQIVDTDGDVVVSRKINNYFDKTVILQLVDHITSSIRNSDSFLEKTNYDEP